MLFFDMPGTFGKMIVQFLELALQLFEFVLRQVLKINEFSPRFADGADQFVELQMNRLGIAILSVLNEENH